MDVEQIAQRSDIALNALQTNGGLLQPETSDRFIRIIMDQPTLIRECRTHRMTSFQTQIHKIGLDRMMLRPARQNTVDYGNGDVRGRALTEAERVAVETATIELNAKEIIAEMRIPYEVLEDNIEQQALQATILEIMGRRTALDLERMLIQSKIGATTLPGEELLKLVDGVLARASAHIVDNNGAGVSDELFNNIIKALPQKYRQNRNLLRLYVNQDVEQDYRFARSQRSTGTGDAALVGDVPLPIFGVAMKGISCLPHDNILLTRPDNIIFGIYRNITMQTEQLISERVVKIVLTLRADVQVEETDAIVKAVDVVHPED